MKCKIKIHQPKNYFDKQFVFEVPIQKLNDVIKDMEQDENVLGYSYFIEERYYTKSVIVRIKYKKFGLAESSCLDNIDDDF